MYTLPYARAQDFCCGGELTSLLVDITLCTSWNGGGCGGSPFFFLLHTEWHSCVRVQATAAAAAGGCFVCAALWTDTDILSRSIVTV